MRRDKPSPRNVPGHSRDAFARSARLPDDIDLRRQGFVEPGLDPQGAEPERVREFGQREGQDQ